MYINLMHKHKKLSIHFSLEFYFLFMHRLIYAQDSFLQIKLRIKSIDFSSKKTKNMLCLLSSVAGITFLIEKIFFIWNNKCCYNDSDVTIITNESI